MRGEGTEGAENTKVFITEATEITEDCGRAGLRPAIG
jgi:hypothetical protein